MEFREVANHFRASTAPLVVSKIIIVSDQGDHNGDGKIWREGQRIKLEVTLHDNEEIELVGGTHTRAEFWKIGGIIEGQTPFWGVSLPGKTGRQMARFTVRSGHFEFDRINHLVVSFEDGNLREAMLEAAKTGEPPGGEVFGDMAFARISDYKLVWKDQSTEVVTNNPFLGDSSTSSRDTLCGAFGTFEYGLVERGDDTEVYVRVKDAAGESRAELRRMMQAMYRSIAFLHGRHCWPQWERFTADLETVAEYATAPRKVSANIHTLLTERTAANGAKPTELIGKLLACFLREDDFAKELDNYLFLAREAAGSDIPARIRTLGLCTVFEGFVGFLYKHFCHPENEVVDADFEHARTLLLRFVRDQPHGADLTSARSKAWQRCVGLLSSAGALRPADKYHRLLTALNLPAGKMQGAVGAWKRYRHPLAHGVTLKGSLMDQMVAAKRGHCALMVRVEAYSRIAF